YLTISGSVTLAGTGQMVGDPGGKRSDGGSYYSTVDVAAGASFTNSTGHTISGSMYLGQPGRPGSAIINQGGIEAGMGSALTFEIAATNYGTLTAINGGTLGLDSDLSNQGLVIVGEGSTVTVQGNYTQGTSASLGIQIGGTPVSGRFGRVIVSGSAALYGTLSISLTNGYVPQAGDRFQIMSYA